MGKGLEMDGDRAGDKDEDGDRDGDGWGWGQGQTEMETRMRMGMEMEMDGDRDRAGDRVEERDEDGDRNRYGWGWRWMGMGPGTRTRMGTRTGLGTGTFWLQGHISCWPCLLPPGVRAASQDAAAAWCQHRDPSVPSPVPFLSPVPREGLQGGGDWGCWCLMGMQHWEGELWACEGVRVLVGVHVCAWGGVFVCVRACVCTWVRACMCAHVSESCTGA